MAKIPRLSVGGTTSTFAVSLLPQVHGLYERGSYAFTPGGATSKYWESIPSWEDVKGYAHVHAGQVSFAPAELAFMEPAALALMTFSSSVPCLSGAQCIWSTHAMGLYCLASCTSQGTAILTAHAPACCAGLARAEHLGEDEGFCTAQARPPSAGKRPSAVSDHYYF